MTYCYRDYSSGLASQELFSSGFASFLQGRTATGLLQRAGVHGSAAVIRRSARYRVGPAVVCLVHSQIKVT